MGSITLAGYAFDGPYTYASLLPDGPGIWAILDGRELPPVDAGEAESVREAVEGHDRYDCWRDRCEQISYAGMVVPDADHRSEILERVVEAYDLPCRPE